MVKSLLDSDSYAVTVRADTLRLLLSLTAEHDLDLASHDIKTTFLYFGLKPDTIIYIRRPCFYKRSSAKFITISQPHSVGKMIYIMLHLPLPGII